MHLVYKAYRPSTATVETTSDPSRPVQKKVLILLRVIKILVEGRFGVESGMGTVRLAALPLLPYWSKYAFLYIHTILLN